MDGIDILLPEVGVTGNLASMQLPDIGDYNFWGLYKKRILSIDSEIENWDYNIVKTIIQFNLEDIGKEKKERKPIIILINSNGGLLNIMNSIIDTITCSTTPVWTVNMGDALSAAALIFLAGEKRFTTKNSWLMTHPGSGGTQGNYTETVEQQKVWSEQVKNMGSYIMERTGIEEKVWKKYKNKDWWLNAEQQIQFGFATDILNSIDDIFEQKENVK